MIKKTLLKISQYFPKPYDRFGENVKVELHLSNYATKADLKGATGVDTSNLALEPNLAEVDELDADKLKAFPVYLSKLSNVVNNEIVKKIVYNKLAAKVNYIDNSGFALKSKYDTDKPSLGKKINNADKKYMILMDFLKNRL